MGRATLGKDIRLAAIVVGSVIAAGYLMYLGRDIEIIANARRGFDPGIL